MCGRYNIGERGWLDTGFVTGVGGKRNGLERVICFLHSSSTHTLQFNHGGRIRVYRTSACINMNESPKLSGHSEPDPCFGHGNLP